MAIKEVLLSVMQESVKKHLDCIERHNEAISKMKNDYMRECRNFWGNYRWNNKKE